MKRRILTLVLTGIVCMLTWGIKAQAQQSNNLDISGYFLKENLNVKPLEPFFNLFILKNDENRPVTVKVAYEVPMGWSLISTNEQRVTIPANDSINLPFRASANQGVTGQIGYSMVATILDLQDDMMNSAYFFVKIPESTDMKFFPITRTSYFSRLKQKARFRIRLSNKGNIDELVDLGFDIPETLKMPDAEEGKYNKQVIVPAREDTILEFSAELNSAISGGDTEHRIDMKAASKNNSFSTSFWFMELTSDYNYSDAYLRAPLVLELNIQNLLSEAQTAYSGSIFGDILFENSREIQYMIRKYSNLSTDNFLRYTLFDINYSSPKLNIRMGDRLSFSSRAGSGRGVELSYNLNDDLSFGLMGAGHIFKPIWLASGQFFFNRDPASFDVNYTYIANNQNNYRGHLAQLITNFGLQGNQDILVGGGISYTGFDKPNTADIGYELKLGYNYEVPDFRINIGSSLASDTYLGSQHGRYEMDADALYYFTDDWRLQYTHRGYRYAPSSYMEDSLAISSISNTQISTMKTRYRISNDLEIIAGPIYSYRKTNSFYLFEQNDFLENQSFGGLAGISITGNAFERIRLSGEYGVNWVSNYSLQDSLFTVPDIRNYPHTKINLRARFSFGGVYINYLYGPYSMNQKLSYLLEDNYTRLLRVMPYAEVFLFKDVVKFTSNLNYLSNLNTNDRRLNLTNELTANLKYNTQIRLLNAFSYQLTYDDVTNEPYKYTNTYFGLTLRKEFNFNQPRVRYHNLSLSLFRDLNGNLVKETNEPGVTNALVQVKSVALNDEQRKRLRAGEERSFNKSFLSDRNGSVKLRNLPEGAYEITVASLASKADKFHPDSKTQTIVLDKDKSIPIPYLERNKIYGRVIINRARLSNLGRIEPSNIKVTAVDSRGRKISTLTDEKGRFSLFAPSVDKYRVYVENIDQEHFKLRKNNYVVQLNGYKQFEVNFIFDEIAPQLNLSQEEDLTDLDMRSIKRTNLSGAVKDENTLQPLRARVEVIDTATMQTRAYTMSSSRTGRYAMTFQTDSGYVMEVKAQGYWLQRQPLNLSTSLTIQDQDIDVLLENIILGARIEVSGLQFEPASAEIPLKATASLDGAARRLKRNPEVRVDVVGYATEQELEEKPNLARERAKSVYDYLSEQGVDNIEYKAFNAARGEGEERESGEEMRKVELVITDK